jgi:hypothetical protein
LSIARALAWLLVSALLFAAPATSLGAHVEPANTQQSSVLQHYRAALASGIVVQNVRSALGANGPWIPSSGWVLRLPAAAGCLLLGADRPMAGDRRAAGRSSLARGPPQLRAG